MGGCDSDASNSNSIGLNIQEKMTLEEFQDDCSLDIRKNDFVCLFDGVDVLFPSKQFSVMHRPSDLWWAGSLPHDFKIWPITFKQ